MLNAPSTPRPCKPFGKPSDGTGLPDELSLLHFITQVQFGLSKEILNPHMRQEAIITAPFAFRPVLPVHLTDLDSIEGDIERDSPKVISQPQTAHLFIQSFPVYLLLFLM